MVLKWEKILEAPTKSFKIEGHSLLVLKNRIDDLNNAKDASTARINELSEIISMLQSEDKAKAQKIKTLQAKVDKLSELATSLESVVSTKDESLGATMNIHANFMKEIDRLSGEVSVKNRENSELNKKYATLEEKVTELEKTNSDLESNSSKIEKKIVELVKILEYDKNDIENSRTRITELQDEIKTKDDLITENNEKIKTKDDLITEKNEKIDALNQDLEDLKAKVPKEDVIEEIEGVVESIPCPKCGTRTFEVYEVVNGEKHLIRHYCPSPNCAWLK